MAYEMNNNTGSLFKNDRRQNDRQPEYRGTALINGKEMRISAWVRTSKNGTKFFSMSFDEVNGAYPQNAGTSTQPTPKATPVNLGTDPSDLPF